MTKTNVNRQKHFRNRESFFQLTLFFQPTKLFSPTNGNNFQPTIYFFNPQMFFPTNNFFRNNNMFFHPTPRAYGFFSVRRFSVFLPFQEMSRHSLEWQETEFLQVQTQNTTKSPFPTTWGSDRKKSWARESCEKLSRGNIFVLHCRTPSARGPRKGPAELVVACCLLAC